MPTRRSLSPLPSGALSFPLYSVVVFVAVVCAKCSSLRKKMEEIAEQEKELARIEAMENALDVTKQDNMGGFYR